MVAYWEGLLLSCIINLNVKKIKEGIAMAKATVLVPTHNHPELLPFAVESAQNQTVEDLELLIVGDGVNDDTRYVVNEIAKKDKRVQFFDFEKGPRHGEILRHQVLQQAKGEIVCYLSDDDLYFESHVQKMIDALTNHDFVNSHCIHIGGNYQPTTYVCNLSNVLYRELLLGKLKGKTNRIGFTSVGHTLKAYYSLPHGWRTSPMDIWTDLYMWRQWLSHKELTFGSILETTFINLPAKPRKAFSMQERVDEIAYWSDLIKNKSLESEPCKKLQTHLLRRVIKLELETWNLEKSINHAANEASKC
jgi:glycosyltransferase involved in cell wall biosynthesis